MESSMSEIRCFKTEKRNVMMIEDAESDYISSM